MKTEDLQRIARLTGGRVEINGRPYVPKAPNKQEPKPEPTPEPKPEIKQDAPARPPVDNKTEQLRSEMLAIISSLQQRISMLEGQVAELSAPKPKVPWRFDVRSGDDGSIEEIVATPMLN